MRANEPAASGGVESEPQPRRARSARGTSGARRTALVYQQRAGTPASAALRSHLVEAIGPAHPGERANVIDDGFVGRLVELDHHEGVAAALFSRQSQRGDVD